MQHLFFIIIIDMIIIKSLGYTVPITGLLSLTKPGVIH